MHEITVHGGANIATHGRLRLVAAGHRDAHEIVGRAVALAVERGTSLAEIPFDDLATLSDRIGEDVYDAITLDGAVAARNHFGGTAPAAVRAAIETARHRL